MTVITNRQKRQRSKHMRQKDPLYIGKRSVRTPNLSYSVLGEARCIPSTVYRDTLTKQRWAKV